MGACLFPPLKLRQIRICTTSSKLLASVFRRSCFSLLCEWGSASQILMMIKKRSHDVLVLSVDVAHGVTLNIVANHEMLVGLRDWGARCYSR